jgi:hypothetical protein
VAFVESGHSCGIQLADFVAGAIHGYLRGYEASEKLYTLRLYAQIRKHNRRGHLGFGIVDVPKRSASRLHLLEKFPQPITEKSISEEEDIAF